MYGTGNNVGSNLGEQITDNWINQNVPGGVNSPMGEQLDNMMGGNPNPTIGQYVGGAPGVGGTPQYGSTPQYGGQYYR
ncbi:unnamed protein product [Adineta steineri]|uniref:Uncharacterized protein n=1 Tax=Adineta steineri TaxID=433720 RepID=A0A814GDN6_9BILA|nr:unnamed protein product [Adineta steineri]CAF0994199.1 unnamed protein product [Adineta steineri]